MTPFHLEILIHHHVSPTNFPRQSKLYEEIAQAFVDMDVLEIKEGHYKMTDKGDAWLRFMLETPLPVKTWTLPK